MVIVVSLPIEKTCSGEQICEPCLTDSSPQFVRPTYFSRRVTRAVRDLMTASWATSLRTGIVNLLPIDTINWQKGARWPES
jgi:hypothetical protein